MRKILLFFALKYKGQWNKIYKALENKERVNDEELKKIDHYKNFITIVDEDYPKSLKRIFQPPFVLFFKGDKKILETDKKLAVIGSRECSLKGKENTFKIIKKLENFVIVSGLAKGIDATAHESALQNNLKTIAVLGTGINYCYPNENYDLYKKIAKNGIIISEYPNDFQGEKENFKIRNRLISGLSQGIIIIESKRKSGTMNTAKFALEQNKDIFCIPSSDLMNSGNNLLIKQGAKLIEESKDIINDLI